MSVAAAVPQIDHAIADGPLVAISVVMPIATRWRQVGVASAASALGIQLEMETKGLLVWIGSVEVEVGRGCGSSELEVRDGSIEARRAANISCGTISGAVMAARAVSTSTTASLRRTFDWLTGPTAGMSDMRDEGEAPTGSGGVLQMEERWETRVLSWRERGLVGRLNLAKQRQLRWWKAIQTVSGLHVCGLEQLRGRLWITPCRGDGLDRGVRHTLGYLQ